MLQACSKCGAANSEHATACSVCDASLVTAEAESPREPALQPVAVLSSEPQWRREVASRLESYRARRRRILPGDSPLGSARDRQTMLPFAPGNGDSGNGDGLRRGRAAPRARKTERVEIAVFQSELDFASVSLHPVSPELPVAHLSERAWAGAFDGLFLFLAYLGFLVLFGSLGGQFSLGKYDAAVYAVSFFLLYAVYFALFTVFGSPTPGMHFRGLVVVSFEGDPPGARQLLWRSFGYLLSAGTLCLGFLWALWDEDRLTWQDRISRTYISAVPWSAEPQKLTSK